MKIKIGFLAICTIVGALLSNTTWGLATILAATLHELSHLGMARLCGISFRELSITPFGASLVPTSSMGSYRTELLIAAAGPLGNLLCILLVFRLSHIPFFFYFLISSLFFALLNLLPVTGFDGGRILLSILSQRLSPALCSRLLTFLSFLVIFFLWSLSVYLLLRVGNSLSLFVFSCSLFLKLFVQA